MTAIGIRSGRACCAVLAAVTLFALPLPGAAIDPYELDVIAPMSGNGAFIGRALPATFAAIEDVVNKSGGIGGRPVHFVILDDQSNPQVALQLANDLVAKQVPIILGPSLSATCNAIIPLVQSGPVLYCYSPAIHPAAGSYVFSAQVETQSSIAASIRYFRLRGMTKIAFLSTTDASGQDGERGVDAALAQPENSSVRLVAREHFAVTDLSVAAQVARIKAANPQLLILWTAGTPTGTALRNMRDAGLAVPALLSAANLTYAQMQQYASFMPPELLYAGVPAMDPNGIANKGVKALVTDFLRAMAAQGVKDVDYPPLATADPTFMVIAALRKLGTNVTADKLRDYLAHQRGALGLFGSYDFQKIPQRGLDDSAVLMVRWDPAKNTWIGISRPGGTPL
jgi:branched-chain amino acid transport system substrate-binding protein